MTPSKLPWLQARGIALIRGHGRLEGERRVRVDEQLYEARLAVVIAVGSGAVLPPIPGLADSRPWTNRDVTTAQEIPARLLVLGGGAVGVEMAQAYSSLGSNVAIIEAEEHLLPREEPFAGEQLRDALLERGVEVHLGVSAQAVHRDERGVSVQLSDGKLLAGDELLVAVGRRALTDELGLETVGLEPGGLHRRRRHPAGAGLAVAVRDRRRQRALPAHAHGQVPGARRRRGHRRCRDPRPERDDAPAPRVVFTDPQIAAVGLTLQGAREQGLNASAYDVPTSATAGASFHGRNTPGTSRLVIDENRGVILGATFTGTDVADWLHAATIAIVGEVPVERLWEAVPAFPTRSEVWLKLLEKREAELARERAGRAQLLAAA